MKFQYIFLTFFGFMAVIAVIVFSQHEADPAENTDLASDIRGDITIWGTFDPITSGISNIGKTFNEDFGGALKVHYRYFDPKTFDQDITEALAADAGPDVLLLPDDLVLRHSNKLRVIPYTSYPERQFVDTFVDAAQIYLRPDGLIAVPFAIDPVMLYWNKDLFATAGLVTPPKKWDELLLLVPQLTKRDRSQNITQSAVALGEYVNIYRAKDILATMLLQIGNPIVTFSSAGVPVSTLVRSELSDDASGATVSALRFYVDFSNPLKSTYSWNRSRGNSRDEFVDGSLAMYFDTASAYTTLRLQNPHLNFDVAQVPQPRDTTVDVTGAKIYGLSVLKSTRNEKAAFEVVKRLLEPRYSSLFFTTSNLPPVRRDLLAKGQPSDAVLATMYHSAIISRAWLDPRPAESDTIFREMVESVISGAASPQAAIATAQGRFTKILEAYKVTPVTSSTPLPGS